MTERIRIEHNFDVSEKGFWDTFLDAEYNRAMFRDSLKFPRWETTTLDVSEEEVVRVVQVEPYVGELPGPVKRVLGSRISFREEGRLDRANNSYKLKIVPAQLADKILISGEQFTEALGEGRCKRVFVAEVKIKIFAIGSIIEKLIAKDMQKGYDVGATFTRDYMHKRGIK